MGRKKFKYAVGLAAVATVLAVGGCSSEVEGTPEPVAVTATSDATTPLHSPGQCQQSSFPTVEANSKPGEPKFALPLLDGWQRNPGMDNDIIRLMLVKGAGAPNVTMTVEKSAVTGSAVVDQQVRGLRQMTGAKNIEVGSKGMTCGFASQPVSYSLAVGDKTAYGTALIIDVPNESGSGATVAVVTVTSVDRSADSVANQKTIFDGIQITR